MHYFFDKIINPYINAFKYLNICEIGAFKGSNTDRFLAESSVRLTVIDPCLDQDLYVKYEDQNRVKLYKGLSLNVLPKLNDVFDCFLIDGDHNWYTVYNELKLIEEKNLLKKGGTIFLHDVKWPYARRDMYYVPESIPRAFRQPYAKKGIIKGSPGLSDESGMNAHMNNALHEGGPKNGVLTAVEDFLKIFEDKYYYFCSYRGEGLGILLRKENIKTFFSYFVWLLKVKTRFYERIGRTKKK